MRHRRHKALVGCPSGKVPWLRRGDARTVARRATSRVGVPLAIYRCPRCTHYHLTSRRS